MQKIILLNIFLSGLTNIFCQYHAIYIPDEKLSEIRMDGDTTDWSWVPEQYVITTAYMSDLLSNKNIDEKSWNCKIIVGWNDVKNWIYIMAVVHDDIINTDGIPEGLFFLDDCMEIAVNPDNLGGKYDNKEDKRCFNTIKIYSVSDSAFAFKVDKGPSWICQKKSGSMDWGYQIHENNKEKTTVVVYEIGMHLWDRWNDEGVKLSKSHRLISNQTIRLTIGINDVDHKTNQREALWGTSIGSWPSNADDISLFVLDPPPATCTSWETIHRLLKP